MIHPYPTKIIAAKNQGAYVLICSDNGKASVFSFVGFDIVIWFCFKIQSTGSSGVGLILNFLLLFCRAGLYNPSPSSSLPPGCKKSSTFRYSSAGAGFTILRRTLPSRRLANPQLFDIILPGRAL